MEGTALTSCHLASQVRRSCFKEDEQLASGSRRSSLSCILDGILVFGANHLDHDKRLEAVMQKLEKAGVTLNRSKCAFLKNQVKFLGHVVNKDGIQADPEKISAIVKMKSPSNITELRRLLGMANQLGKFSPNMAKITQPLRSLLNKNCSWYWDTPQEESFAQLKSELADQTHNINTL